MKFSFVLVSILLFIGSTIYSQPADSISLAHQYCKKKTWWITPALAVSYSSTILATYKFADTKVQKFSQANHSGFLTGVSKSVTNMGLGKFQAISLGATAIIAFASRSNKLKKTVFIWGTSLVLNSIVTSQLKYSFQRHRPNTNDPFNTFDWRGANRSNTSFPSAHTSNAFTTATVFASIYKDIRWVPPVAYGLATLVGISRIYDNAHWGSDVLMGAAVGFLSAKASILFYKIASRRLRFLPSSATKATKANLEYLF